MAKNPQFHGRSKHINIKFHFIREQVSTKKIYLKYCQSEDMLADLLTKESAQTGSKDWESCVEWTFAYRVRRSVEVVHSQPTALTTRTLKYRSSTMWHAFGTQKHSRTFFMHVSHIIFKTLFNFMHLSSVSHYLVVVTKTLLFCCIAIKLCCYATSKRRTAPINTPHNGQFSHTRQ